MNLESLSQLQTPISSPDSSANSQESLRSAYQQKFKDLKAQYLQAEADYKQALKDYSFEDQDNEELGSGNKRKLAKQQELTNILSKAEKIKALLNSNQPLPELLETSISTTYTYANPETNQVELTETINLDIEQKLDDYLNFYQKHNIVLPLNFKDTIKDIWSNNYDQIQQEIKDRGYNEILIIPGNLPLPDLKDKMAMIRIVSGGRNFDDGGGWACAKSKNVDKHRLVLVHNTKELADRPELKKTLNIKGGDVDLNHTLTLEDYLIFQRHYFETTDEHLDETNWTWLATKSWARLVHGRWNSGASQLNFEAFDIDVSRRNIGARPSCSFFS